MDALDVADEEQAGRDAPADARAQRSLPPAFLTQRSLQVVLGLFWVLDAALQFQPFMFGRGFVQNVILASASGQPFVVGDLITHIGNFLAPDIAVWNALFALLQLFIGVGLLFRRTVRPALAVSFVWVLGVWFFGEGLGMLLTGMASALTGAPGSVLLYGLLGLMAWPRSRRTAHAPAHLEPAPSTGVASSAAAQGLGRSITPLATWSGYWCLAAVLFLLPDNRTRTSISSAITGMAPGQPGWYGHFLTSLGNQFSTTGTETAWILAAVSLVVGLGPPLARRPGWFLVAGAVLSFLMWMTAQGLFGNVFSGSATDPNSSPLVILLAAAMLPVAVAARHEWRSPAAEVADRTPAAALLGVCGLGACLALAATYPVAAQESSGSAMSGMSMGGSSTAAMDAGSGQAGAATCTPHQSGLKISGLDLANTPFMNMGGGTAGMDMNGADASAAAGLNVTKPNWHYDGPALPAAMAQQLLADGNNGPDDIEMALNGCARGVTVGQEIGAQQYVQQTSAAVAGDRTPADAVAAGYQPVSPTDYPVVTYVNPSVVASNAAARRTLSPQHVDGLVYATTPSRQQVLAAAMYILPSTVSGYPMPYGPLVQWHRRTAACGDGSVTADMPLTISGFPPCAAGSRLQSTPYVSMVWQVPVAGGPLAVQPPDIQIVEAAIMQSQGSNGSS